MQRNKFFVVVALGGYLTNGFAVELPLAAKQTLVEAFEETGLKVSLIPSLNIVPPLSTKQPFYQTKLGNYLFHFTKEGTFLYESVENSTQIALKETLNALDDKHFIFFSPTQQPRFKITVLTDVTCPYSLGFHREIEWLNAEGVEIRYLPFPRGDEESLSFKKMHAVWCNANRHTTFEQAIQNQRFRLEDCQTFALSAGSALGNVLNIKGTPTLLFEDGTVSTGYSSAVDILDYLEKGTPLKSDGYSAKE
ncbi:MAG: hypothetical protein RIT27_1811 [Pseudomonadota bacterium]|jgi:thiol:disulfide interchange protein DsbC